MIFTTKKEVFTVSEFLARQPKESAQSKTPQQNYTPLMGFMGIDVTHGTFFSPSFSGAYWMVFGVAAVALLSTLLEYLYRRKGKEVTADIIATSTKIMFPIAFYIYLYFGIIAVF
ncbi:hypothetical protein QFZ28_004342 [Neobacillus niacini]|uniref:hypothetical protein n=1 Tax=Neobacillus niacini TaxID=86668 RepID=UPI00277D9C6E|nr:hypothetical protein [Neobacillus niacini]MDQ1003942.1 hypothetical protein [Neobacillus niacini]